MKNNSGRSIYCVLFLLFPLLSLSQQSLPSYKLVVTAFFEKYNDENNPEKKLGFAKKKDGWHVLYTNPYKNDEVITDQLFWPVAKKVFLPIKEALLQTDITKVKETVNAFIATSYFNEYGFERCRYYGYNGWDADMIADFENAPNKNDTLLECLARAYSAYASRFLWYQYGGSSLTGDPLQVPLARNEMPSEARIQKMIAWQVKAIETYNRLKQVNPRYETWVGNIGLKCFNENIHAYVQLQFCNRENLAKKFLDNCVLPYDDSAGAANLLNSTEPNAILFTYGDNDTYPVLYLQQKRNLRKDVTVLNTNLLGFVPNLQWLNRSKAVAFSTPAAEYSKKEFDIVFYNASEAIPKQKLADFLTSLKWNKKLATENADSVRSYYSTKLYLPVDNNWFIKNKSSKPSPDTLPIQLGQYVMMDEIITLDIINENIGKRPIFFTAGGGGFFANSTIPTGVALKLATVYDEDEFIQSTEDYLANRYIAPFKNINNPAHEQGYSLYLNNHFYLYSLLLRHYYINRDKEKTGELVKNCFESFKGNIPYYTSPEHLVNVLYESNHDKIADAIVDRYSEVTLKRCLQPGITSLYQINTEFGKSRLMAIRQLLASLGKENPKLNNAISELEKAAKKN